MWKGLGALLAQQPKKRSMMQSVASAMTVEEAATIIQAAYPKFGSIGTVESIANGVLTLRAGTNIAMQELTLRRRNIERALANKGITVRDIRIRMHFERPETPSHDDDHSSE